MALEQSLYGSFSFNKMNYIKAMRKLRDKVNDYHNYNYELSIIIYNLLKKNKVKKNEYDAYKFIHSIDLDLFVCKNNIKDSSKFCPNNDSIQFALDEIFRNENNTILKPRRSAYPKLTNKDKSLFLEVNCYSISIVASIKSATLKINVGSGKNNCRNAERFQMYKEFFSIINANTWSKKEGGFVTETEESTSDFEDDDLYNTQDSCYKGDIGNEQKKYNISRFR